MTKLISRNENKWWSTYHHLVVPQLAKMVILVLNKYEKMFKPENRYSLKISTK